MTMMPQTHSSETSRLETSLAERRRLQARARRLTQRAQTLAGEGRFAEAIACQSEVTSLRPQDAGAFFRLGLLCREARRTDQAVQALRQATDLDPAGRDPREALTETLVEANRYEEAVQEARALIKVVPRSLFARDVLSVSYLQLGKFDKALQMTGEMIWLDPLNPNHHFRRGLLFQQQGNLRAAVGAYGRALDMSNPESETYQDATEAVEILDDNQTRQILLLASEDRLFLLKLRRDLTEAVQERGFFLSEDGMDRLNHLLLHEFPDWIGDRPASVQWGGLGLYN
jgi:tetratricopeptide (TPR) repeat protein